MRSVLSLRVVAAATATVIAVLAATAVVSRPPRAPALRPPPYRSTLTEVVDATSAEGSARLAGTAIDADGTTVDLVGLTSFTTPDAVLFARNGADEAAVEVRTTAEGTWLRSPSLGGWIALEATSALTPGAANGWADVLARLRDAPAPRRTGRRFDAVVEGEPVVAHIDDKGRLRRVRIERQRRIVDVTFSDFGVVVEVEAPEGVVAEP